MNENEWLQKLQPGSPVIISPYGAPSSAAAAYLSTVTHATPTQKERRPVGASDDPRHPAVKACGAT